MEILEVILWIILILVLVATLAHFKNSLRKETGIALTDKENRAISTSLRVTILSMSIMIMVTYYYHDKISLMLFFLFGAWALSMMHIISKYKWEI